MKKFIVAFVLFSLVGIFHSGAQEADASGKGWWQYGVTVRYGGTFAFTNETAAVFNAGYRFNRKNYLGISAGYGRGNTYVDADCGTDYSFNGIPVTIDYLHNFYLGKAKKHSIYLGPEIGALLSWESAQSKCTDEVHSFGSPIIMLKTGFDFELSRRLHLNFGFRVGVLALGASVGVSF